MNEVPHETPWQDLFNRLMAGQEASVELPESRLQASIYHDPGRYEAEMAHLFRRLPLCLGHEDQWAEPGSMLARHIAGQPLLIIRDADGGVGVFLNACRHRGTRLVPEQDKVCRQSALSCPYHGWTYDLGGSLVAVPRRQEAFPTLDLGTRGLRRLPCVVHHGLVWTVLEPGRRDMPDMAAYLGPLDNDLAALRLGGHRFFRQHAVRRAANWKLIIDAFMEVYHVKRLHHATIGPFFLDSRTATDHVGPHQRMLVARDGLEAIHDLPAAQWDPQRHATFVHLIFPNSLIIYHPDYISHLGLFPVAAGETLFVHTMLTPEAPTDPKTQSHWDRSFELIDGQVFNKEDLSICEQIQSALVHGADNGVKEDFVLGRFEANLRRFHATIEAAVNG